MFKKKEKTISQKQVAVQERLSELRKQMDVKQKGISEAKDNLSSVLGNMALADTPQNQDAVKRAKKVLVMQMNGLEDLKVMLTLLEGEQKNLATEALRATIREAPAKATAAAIGYNAMLKEAISALDVLRSFHGKMLKAQTAYNGILQERAQALKTLGLVEGLDMKVGLGELSQVPTPHRYVMETTSTSLDMFLLDLVRYEKMVRDYQAFTQGNPSYGEIETAQNISGIGEMDPPTRHQEFKEVFVPPAR